MNRLSASQEEQLLAFANKLVDQTRARIIIPPNRDEPGFWFGGGNLAEDADGRLYLVGRYRNQGDSRSGLAAGERGCELAIFCSQDRGRSFQKVVSFSKADLQQGERRVVSIEGSALRISQQGVELFVSSEKDGIGYPPPFESHLKPGCGVWTIDRLTAPTVESLQEATVEPLVESRDIEHLHLKDPHTYVDRDGGLVLIYCSHPFSWSSSNTVFARRPPRADQFDSPDYKSFPRGTTWDVAIARGSCLLDVPAVGPFAGTRITLLFYDGGESLRNMEEHAAGIKRPRGYSCEELGGVAYFLDGDRTSIQRLSRALPTFVSPYGTGCSRYVDVLTTAEGYFATWQQSQPDFSQPLVMQFVSHAEIASTLGPARH